MTTPEPPAGPPAPEGKPELNAAYQELLAADAKRQAALLAPPPPPPPRSRAPVALAIVAVAVAITMFVALRRNQPPPLEEPAMRARMVEVSRLIGAFQAEHGRSPRTLRELGHEPPGVGYRIVNAETWELFAARGRDTLRLRTGQDTSLFLAPGGDAPALRP